MEGVVYMTLFTHVFREVMLGGLLASCMYNLLKRCTCPEHSRTMYSVVVVELTRNYLTPERCRLYSPLECTSSLCDLYLS